jgi:motA/tolQ/exbB proton channel
MNGTALNEALERTVLMFSRRLNARLDMLSLLANIAPLCGLLGTVTGLMAAFDEIQKLGGAVNISALAGGIWSAMITTATGLLAAIPALVAVRLFERDFLSAWTM